MNYTDNLKDKKFSIFVCPSKSSHTHSHNFMELVYVLKGEADHCLDKASVHIKEGDYFVIDYQSRHSYRCTTDEFEVINCLFVPELIDPSLINCRSLQTLISSYQIHFKNEFFVVSPAVNVYRDDDGKIKALLFSVLEEFEQEKAGYLQIIRSKIIEILIITMRKIYYAPKHHTQNDDMDQILAVINSEYMNDITLGAICNRFNYSFSYLSMKFKKSFGLSYIEYLQKIRVEQSMRLLVHTNSPVNEIAHEVGYKDIKSFYAVFKRFAGTTPARFRKTYYESK